MLLARLRSRLFPYTTLFRSSHGLGSGELTGAVFLCAMATFAGGLGRARQLLAERIARRGVAARARAHRRMRSEEHTSELQSRVALVCRLLLEKKKVTKRY